MKMSLMGIHQTMKVHQLARGFWEHESPALSLSCKRLRPLAPKLPTATEMDTETTNQSSTTAFSSFDLKSFIRPESGPRKIGSPDCHKKEAAPHVVESLPGGTRWNPTQEQIGILEMLYRGGMRTPNAQQIEQITSQLSSFGKIEGKNVFYWFQNHKARERQKQKRNSLALSHSPRTPPSPFSTTTTSLVLSPNKGDVSEVESDGVPYKRKCSTWVFDQFLDNEVNGHGCYTEQEHRDAEDDRTLKLFPLHPEGRSS